MNPNCFHKGTSWLFPEWKKGCTHAKDPSGSRRNPCASLTFLPWMEGAWSHEMPLHQLLGYNPIDQEMSQKTWWSIAKNRDGEK